MWDVPRFYLGIVGHYSGCGHRSGWIRSIRSAGVTTPARVTTVSPPQVGVRRVIPDAPGNRRRRLGRGCGSRFAVGVNISEKVRAAGGILRTSELREQGASNRALTEVVASGAAIRPRRGWIALPDADPGLVAAARHGVIFGCVTLAQRRGLWVLETGRPHVAAPPKSGSVTAKGVVVHWDVPVVPRKPWALEDHLENALVAVARCQPFESALAVWESALRQGLVSRDVLLRLPLPVASRRILEACSLWSDSGLETFVIPRLRWLRLPLRQQIWLLGHRVDLLIGDRLMLQIDGAHHTGAQRDSDIAHDAHLMLAGYHVIRVSYIQIIERWADVQEVLMRAIAQGLHQAG